jgi:prepilin-type processing-associated H-X9-DG protein
MPSGDLMVCRGIEPTGSPMPSCATVEGEQRVLRRLLTSPGSYIWHLEYGAGLPQYVGRPGVPSAVNALIVGQMFLEDTVARDPLPTVRTRPIVDGISVNIAYADGNVGRIVTLGFDINA